MFPVPKCVPCSVPTIHSSSVAPRPALPPHLTPLTTATTSSTPHPQHHPSPPLTLTQFLFYHTPLTSPTPFTPHPHPSLSPSPSPLTLPTTPEIACRAPHLPTGAPTLPHHLPAHSSPSSSSSSSSSSLSSSSSSPADHNGSTGHIPAPVRPTWPQPYRRRGVARPRPNLQVENASQSSIFAKGGLTLPFQNWYLVLKKKKKCPKY